MDGVDGDVRGDFAIQQQKTSRTLKVNLSDATRALVGRYIANTAKRRPCICLLRHRNPPVPTVLQLPLPRSQPP